MTLYHYTCDHGRAAIGDTGALVPSIDRIPASRLGILPDYSLTAARFVWLTDLDAPARDGLGLTSHILKCDRTAHRYRVLNEDVCLAFAELLRGASPDLASHLRELTTTPGATPMHWWVSVGPVPVVYDPIVARERVAS